jgi:hypothetical protein
MASVLLVGSDPASLEGIAQSLAGTGHRIRFAHSLSEAMESALGDAPLVAVVERRLVCEPGASRRLPLAPGGTMVLYRSPDDAQPSLPPSLLRSTIADLALPLERQRLVALINQVEERVLRSGRGDTRRHTPPEPRRTH